MLYTYLYKDMWKHVLAFVKSTHNEANLNEYYEKILDSLNTFIPYDAAHILLHDSQENFSEFITVNIQDDTVEAYREYFQFIDPLKENMYDSPSAIKSSLTLDYRRWKRSEYFQDFLVANNFYYLCGVDIHYQGKLLITISLIRSKSSGDFTAPEILFLERTKDFIAGHIQLLLQINPQSAEENKLIQTIFRENVDSMDFTPREKEIVRLVKAGHTNKEISEELFISINTVKKHLQNIYRKSEVSNRQALISTLFEN